MGRFIEAYLTGMSKHFTSKGDLTEAMKHMQSRMVGLKLDMEYADLFKLDFSFSAEVSSDGSIVMAIINPENGMKKNFLNFEFQNRQGAEIQPSEGHRWLYTQAFVEAGSFLRGVAFIKNGK